MAATPNDSSSDSTGQVPVALHFDLVGDESTNGVTVLVKARERSSGRVVAIHRLSSDSARDSWLRDRFQSDAQAARLLAHPMLARIYDVAWDETSPYCVAEWIDGAPLAERLASEPLAESEVYTLGRMIADAIAYAHERGVALGNVSPENVLLLDDGRLKLCGIGVSGLGAPPRPQRADDPYRELDAAGHPVLPSVAGDIQSFGKLLFHAMTGEEPHSVALGVLPTWLSEIVARCLAGAGARRFQRMSEVGVALAAWAERFGDVSIADTRSRVDPKTPSPPQDPSSLTISLSPTGSRSNPIDPAGVSRPSQQGPTVAPTNASRSRPKESSRSRARRLEDEARTVPPGESSPTPGGPFPWQPLEDLYEVQGKPLQGGMGAVLKARDRATGRMVAIKRIRKDMLEAQYVVQRFHREAQSIARLNHGNILSLLHCSRDEDGDYIVLEWADGGSLRERLTKDRKLPKDEVILIARKIGSALSHAHAKGIVHRDIKPHNVLMTESGEPKLADFGLARTAGDLTITSSLAGAGTPLYIAPEQWKAASGADHRSDLYSFGKMLYHLATGEPPATIDLTLLPPELRRPIEGCVRDKPEDRWQSVVRFLEELDRAVARERSKPLRRAIGIGAGLIAAITATFAAMQHWTQSETDTANGTKTAGTPRVTETGNGDPVETDPNESNGSNAEENGGGDASGDSSGDTGDTNEGDTSENTTGTNEGETGGNTDADRNDAEKDPIDTTGKTSGTVTPPPAPVLRVVAFADDGPHYAIDRVISIAGSVQHPPADAAVSIERDGKPVPQKGSMAPDGSFRYDVSLEPNADNSIAVLFPGVQPVRFHVIHDDRPPAIEFLGPDGSAVEGFVTSYDASYVVSATVKDGNGVREAAESIAAPSSASPFSQAVDPAALATGSAISLPLAEYGKHTLVLTAKDVAGNEAKHVLEIERRGRFPADDSTVFSSIVPDPKAPLFAKTVSLRLGLRNDDAPPAAGDRAPAREVTAIELIAADGATVKPPVRLVPDAQGRPAIDLPFAGDKKEMALTLRLSREHFDPREIRLKFQRFFARMPHPDVARFGVVRDAERDGELPPTIHDNNSGVDLVLVAGAKDDAGKAIPPFYLGLREVSIGEFRKWPGHAAAKDGMSIDREARLVRDARTSFENPLPDWPELDINQPKNDKDSFPATFVSYTEAEAFCRHFGFRLPDSTRWLAAAGKFRDDTARCNLASDECEAVLKFNVSRGPDGWQALSPAGLFLADSRGFRDLYGNVWEWTSDAYESDKKYRTLIGGSWIEAPEDLATSVKLGERPDRRTAWYGFRVLFEPRL